jgi:hypothetical protein
VSDASGDVPEVADCAPQLSIEPAEFTFTKATPSNPESKQFRLENQGNCPLVIYDVELTQTGWGYTLEREFDPGARVAAQGSPDYASLIFTLSYHPSTEGADETATVKVYSNDATSPVDVIVVAKVGACSLELSYPTQDMGFLDFSDAADSQMVTMTNNNSSNVVLLGVLIPEDSEGLHFSTEICLVKAQGEPQCGLGVPLSIAPTARVEITVTKLAEATLEGGTLKLVTDCPGHTTVSVPIRSILPPPCVELAPGSLAKPMPLVFYSPGGRKRHLVLFNCGPTPLELTGVLVVSEDGDAPWKLADDPEFGSPIGAFGMRYFSLETPETATQPAVGEIVLTLSTSLDISYPLELLAANNTQPPVANAGKFEDFLGMPVDKPLTLDGSASTPGLGGIYEVGYLWYLLQKPEGSKLMLNGPPGLAKRTVVPDKAGEYLFGLQVQEKGGQQLFGVPDTLIVVVSD